MHAIFDTVLPFFALIFCGYVAGRFEVLGEASIAGVNAFVFYFALPAFLFDLMATFPITDVLNGSFITAYLGTGLVVFTLAGTLGRFALEVRAGEATLLGAPAVLGNTGYMGLSLISAALGHKAAIPLVIGLTPEATVLIPLSMVLVEAGKGSDGGWAPDRLGSRLAGPQPHHHRHRRRRSGVGFQALVAAAPGELHQPAI